jgi:GTP cyclohydrolase I
MVLAKQIPFRSICEHHRSPFTGVAHVGYLPGNRILGLSKLARLVETFAAAPQMQERLNRQIAEWLNENLEPRGVGLALEAEHTCMTHRGVQAYGTRLMTSVLLGQLRDERRRGPNFRPDWYRPHLTPNPTTARMSFPRRPRVAAAVRGPRGVRGSN